MVYVLVYHIVLLGDNFYQKLNYKEFAMNFKYAIFLLFFSCNVMHSDDSIKFTVSETARLREYLVDRKSRAMDEIKKFEIELQSALDKKYDANSPAIKNIKNSIYSASDIVSHTNRLLRQLDTRKYTYALVVAELQSLGSDPQSVLNVTGVREKLLTGQKVHPLTVEIEAINYELDKSDIDEAFLSQKVGPREDNRLMYIATSLTDRLSKKHSEISDVIELKSNISILKHYLTIFQQSGTLKAVQKKIATSAFEVLKKIDIDRIK